MEGSRESSWVKCKKEVLISLLEESLKTRKRAKERYNWALNARESQKIPEGDWKIWLIMAGRGFGKTRTGAETIRALIKKGYRRICLLGNTELDVINVMLGGESGLMSISPDKERPKFNPSKRTLTWPCGAKAYILSATAYEQLRGPQFDAAWIDELAKFPDAQAAFDQLLLALRLNSKANQPPKMIITTTPKPMQIIKDLIAKGKVIEKKEKNESVKYANRNNSGNRVLSFHEDMGDNVIDGGDGNVPDEKADVLITYGTTFENKNNLSQSFLESVEQRFGSSKFGKQELLGRMVEDDENAFCKSEMILTDGSADIKKCKQIIIAVDPAATKSRDETGIVVCGLLDSKEESSQYVILEDASGHYTPAQWSEKIVDLYHFYKADCIVAEVNQGGDMVETLIKQQDASVAYQKVYATRGKYVRAYPISALYEQRKVLHAGAFEKLEEQMTVSKHSHSPDRLDALVWGLTFLMKKVAEAAKTDSKPFFAFSV